MEKAELEIIAGAFALFNKYGIRSVTMDDLAREMGISKKTLYKYFENKAELVQKCIAHLFESISTQVEHIHQQTQNAIDELFDIDEAAGTIMENHNPSLQFQLMKYYPSTYRYMEQNRRKMIERLIRENIETGQEQGMFRRDLEAPIVTYLYCLKVEEFHEEDNSLLKQYKMRKIMRESLIYHIRAIATPEGLSYLENKLTKHSLQ